MPTRWNLWYSEENLEKDPRILAAKPSLTAEKAAELFRTRGINRILDLDCGVGRDTRYFSHAGFQVLGADAAINGVLTARGRAAEFGLPQVRLFTRGMFEKLHPAGRPLRSHA